MVKAHLAAEIEQQYLLTFALKHHLTRLNYFTHAWIDSSIVADIPEDLCSAFENVWQTVADANIWPIIGFNAAGSFVAWQRIGRCRFLDAYDRILCDSNSQTVFCDQHREQSAWWDDSGHLDTLGTMMAFYWDLENIHAYSPQDLDRLLYGFWESYAKSAVLLDTSSWDKALSLFSLTSLEELVSLGLPSLRGIYLRRCMECHPDKGGEESQFVELAEAYRCLSGYLAAK